MLKRHLAQFDGYRISEGNTPIMPRRTADSLGKGGELWRFTPTNLQKSEVQTKNEVKASGDVESSDIDAVVARRMAGVRAEARAGYSVDGHHEWQGLGRHSQYIQNGGARIVAATFAIEDALDAVS